MKARHRTESRQPRTWRGALSRFDCPLLTRLGSVLVTPLAASRSQHGQGTQHRQCQG